MAFTLYLLNVNFIPIGLESSTFIKVFYIPVTNKATVSQFERANMSFVISASIEPDEPLCVTVHS